MDVDAKRRGEGGGGRGVGSNRHLQTTGQKLTKSCGRHSWMAP